MTIRHRPSARGKQFGLLLMTGLLAIMVIGCATGRGGKGGWFGSKQPEPPQTIADFMKQPRPK